MCASEKIDFSNFLFALIIKKVITFELIRKRLTVEKENLIERGVFMKRITIVALILMLAISAGIANSSARPALPAGSAGRAELFAILALMASIKIKATIVILFIKTPLSI